MTALFSIKQRFVYSYRLIKNLFLGGRSVSQGLIFFFFSSPSPFFPPLPNQGCLFIGLIFLEVKIHFEM